MGRLPIFGENSNFSFSKSIMLAKLNMVFLDLRNFKKSISGNPIEVLLLWVSESKKRFEIFLPHLFLCLTFDLNHPSIDVTNGSPFYFFSLLFCLNQFMNLLLWVFDQCILFPLHSIHFCFIYLFIFREVHYTFLP